MKVVVGIKTLNEERHIADSLVSAINAVKPLGGEVILADSGSTDRTIEIARQFPVRIFQLANPSERSCGTGAQLAYQHARSDYFYLLDGDMVLDPGFLSAGIAYLGANPGIAAVGGHVRERNTDGQEFQIRVAASQRDPNRLPGIVDRLDGGGLYRATAVQQVKYFADRNLHAFEEFELAARLRSHGWKLARIDLNAVDHYGYVASGYRLLWRRIRSGYVDGAGEVLRGAIGRHHFSIVLRELGHLRNGAVVIAWWFLLIGSALVASWFLLFILTLPIVFLWYRRGSFRLGLYSFATWNAYAWGVVSGLVGPRVSPTQPLASIELTGLGNT